MGILFTKKLNRQGLKINSEREKYKAFKLVRNFYKKPKLMFIYLFISFLCCIFNEK
ncbi:hypothetical protein VRK_12590 [Vibrio sp. MEBiC08052]|nr:hypothetical protein VRK_12590 [Vibrio sp. MEBiC08052]